MTVGLGFRVQVSVQDRMEVIDRRRTSDGFLATKGRISKTGIYKYSRGELKLDGNPSELVNIYRPEDSVFSDESMASAAHRPLTLNHPPVFVDSSNWKTYSVGHAGSKVRRDGEFVEVEMLLMDGPAISAVEKGADLSPGYTAEIVMDSGTSPEGEHYDGVMHGPYKFNHIAVLTGKGRGGPKVCLGDAWPVETQDSITPKKETPKVATIVVDGIPVKTDDADAIEAAFKKLVDARTAAEKAMTDAQAKAAEDATKAAQLLSDEQAKVSTLTAEKTTLETQLKDSALTPEKLRDAAAAYAGVVGKAKAMGVTVADNASESDIKRAVVDGKLGEASKGWTDAQVDVSFATLTAGIKAEDAATVTDSLRQTFTNPVDVTNVRDAQVLAKSARQEMIDRMNPVAADAK